MDWTTMTAEQQLRWYFTEAAGACGVRSVQSGFEATMGRLVNCAPPEPSEIHLHETRGAALRKETPETLDGMIALYAEESRSLIPIARARAIYQRLAMLSGHDRRVLELQFGCASRMGDVSLSLVCTQAQAIRGHRKAAEKNRKSAEHRERAQSEAKPKRRLKGGSTVRDWVMWVLASGDAQELNEAIKSARAEIERALRAYIETSGKLRGETRSD